MGGEKGGQRSRTREAQALLLVFLSMPFACENTSISSVTEPDLPAAVSDHQRRRRHRVCSVDPDPSGRSSIDSISFM